MKKIIFIIFRIVVFIFIALFISYLLYKDASSSVQNFYSYKTSELLNCQPLNSEADNKNDEGNKKEEYLKILGELNNTIKESDIKLFRNNIKFNILVENNFKVRDANTNEDISTKFNIEKNGKYIEVLSGQKRLLLDNLNLGELKNIEPDNFLFKLVGESVSTTAKFISSNNESIKFYIELSSWNYLIFIMISVPITWGMFLLANSLWKFILFGKPFTKEDKGM